MDLQNNIQDKSDKNKKSKTDYVGQLIRDPVINKNYKNVQSKVASLIKQNYFLL